MKFLSVTLTQEGERRDKPLAVPPKSPHRRPMVPLSIDGRAESACVTPTRTILTYSIGKHCIFFCNPNFLKSLPFPQLNSTLYNYICSLIICENCVGHFYTFKLQFLNSWAYWIGRWEQTPDYLWHLDFHHHVPSSSSSPYQTKCGQTVWEEGERLNSPKCYDFNTITKHTAVYCSKVTIHNVREQNTDKIVHRYIWYI